MRYLLSNKCSSMSVGPVPHTCPLIRSRKVGDLEYPEESRETPEKSRSPGIKSEMGVCLHTGVLEIITYPSLVF